MSIPNSNVEAAMYLLHPNHTKHMNYVSCIYCMIICILCVYNYIRNSLFNQTWLFTYSGSNNYLIPCWLCRFVLRTTLGTKRRPGLGKVVIVYSKLSGRKPENQSHTQSQTTGNRMVNQNQGQSQVSEWQRYKQGVVKNHSLIKECRILNLK